MAPPVLLTAPTPLDTDPLKTDSPDLGHVARPPLSVPGILAITLPHLPRAGPFPSTLAAVPNSTGTDAYDPEDASKARARVRQWTGVPIRAIVPLPRRRTTMQPLNASRVIVASSSNTTVIPSPPSLTYSRDDADTDSEHETDGEEGGEGEGGAEDDDAPLGLRYCSYESITAAEGLSAWSFEELRVECYAQSLVAAGTKPPPVVRSSLAIPPAFVPRIVSRS